MKRYRLKKGEAILLSIGNGILYTNGERLTETSLQLELQNMSRFDWLYGEENDLMVVLYIPYPLPYISFRIPVPKNLVEEIEEV